MTVKEIRASQSFWDKLKKVDNREKFIKGSLSKAENRVISILMVSCLASPVLILISYYSLTNLLGV